MVTVNGPQTSQSAGVSRSKHPQSNKRLPTGLSDLEQDLNVLLSESLVVGAWLCALGIKLVQVHRLHVAEGVQVQTTVHGGWYLVTANHIAGSHNQSYC